MQTVGCIYEENSRSMDKYYSICNATAKQTELIVLVIPKAFMFFMSLLAICGILDAVLFDYRQPLAHLYLPGIYVYDDWLFVLVTAYNICVLAIGYLMLLSADLLFFVVTANASITPAIVLQNMNELSVKLRNSERREENDEIHQMFSDYIAMHQKFNA